MSGVLKGFDQLLNLVMDECVETIKSRDVRAQAAARVRAWVEFEEQEVTRDLGLIVCRGPTVLLIAPADGSEEIENPFVSPDE